MKKYKDKIGKDNKVTGYYYKLIFYYYHYLTFVLIIVLRRVSLNSPGPSQTHGNPPASDS